jgi:hypothetical protein
MRNSPINKAIQYKLRNRHMEHPLLYLGLIGFDAESEAAVRLWLSAKAEQAGQNSAVQHPVWRVVDFLEADALLIRGAGVVQGYSSHLKFLPSLQITPSSATHSVDLRSLRVPYALSDVEHLQSLGIPVGSTPAFNIRHDAGMLKVIQHFETVLRPLCALFTLAQELIERKHELDKDHTYHLQRNGILDAIVDVPKRRVLLRPGTKPADIQQDAWLSRPSSANYAPANFVECSLDEVGWVFANHCVDFELPERYRSKPIHILRNPRVRDTLLYRRHTTLIDQLWLHPVSFERLQELYAEHNSWLERDLYALYLVRSISTQARTSQAGEASSLPGSSDRPSPPILQRLSKRMNNLAGELQTLF